MLKTIEASMQIPIVHAPQPTFERTAGGAIRRGDGLVSDNELTSVGMRAYRRGRQGLLTVAHGIGASGEVKHVPSGTTFSLRPPYDNEWPAWDVAFIQLSEELEFSEVDRDPRANGVARWQRLLPDAEPSGLSSV